MKTDKPWSGRFCFDIPRHREYMGFAKDWPRMNTLPEGSTVEPPEHYTVHNLADGSEQILTGRRLNEGLAVTLNAGAEQHLLVQQR